MLALVAISGILLAIYRIWLVADIRGGKRHAAKRIDPIRAQRMDLIRRDRKERMDLIRRDRKERIAAIRRATA